MEFLNIKYLLILLLFIPQDEQSVIIYRQDKIDRIEIYAKNNNIYPVTVEVNFELQNLKPTEKLPYTTELRARENANILDLQKEGKNKEWNYRSSLRYFMGSVQARHDNRYAYKLPFAKGQSYWLSQGFNGSFSHQGDLKHSLDFQMDESTPVYAARGGIVVSAVGEHSIGGPTEDFMEFANHITIMHSDGTFADYSHLMHEGVEVAVGRQVQKGQLIGYSGATGYATGPHLHFVVKKAKKGGGYESIPVRFTTKDGIQYLNEGNFYMGY